MPLASITELMNHAESNSYAVGYFESWNLESLQGVIDAAEYVRAPVIVGFNGEFLSHRERASLRDVDLLGALGVAAASQAEVPCGLIFNECSDDGWTEHAIGTGFNLVMPADPEASLDCYAQRVSRLTVLAHARGVAVEAEIDELPCGEEEGSESDPGVAEEFVRSTGVDLLAVSVGNEHMKVSGSAPLNLERLNQIKRRVKIPLVLHGGSGIQNGSLRDAVSAGIRKVNYGTYIKQRYLSSVPIAMSQRIMNPHELLGDGGPRDAIAIGRRTVRDAVLERIEVLGCVGQAGK